MTRPGYLDGPHRTKSDPIPHPAGVNHENEKEIIP
nr:MAG TPA: hypothetical protein [Caudoviricetes sp.]